MILRFSCKKSIQNKNEKAFIDYARQMKKKKLLAIHAKHAVLRCNTAQNATSILYRMHPRCCTECGRDIAGFAHPMLYRMGTVH